MKTTTMKRQKHLVALDNIHRNLDQPYLVNVNEVHQELLSTNDRIARFVSDHVGTMYFCYCLATLMFLWSIGQIFVFPALGVHPFDPYPFSFLFFILGGIMQSLLMPLIMVAQNQASKHTELRAESDHHINQSNFAYLKRHQEILEEQNAVLKDQSDMLLLLIRGMEKSRSRIVKTGMRSAKKEHVVESGITQEVQAVLAPKGKSA